MARSKKLDSRATVGKGATAILEATFGPGCDKRTLGTIDATAAHAFYHQVLVATETLEGKVGPGPTMKFLRKVLNRLNEKL